MMSSLRWIRKAKRPLLAEEIVADLGKGGIVIVTADKP
jgi:hypothetical protein